MPESPRWLIAHNRRKEAKILIEKACKRASTTATPTALTSGVRSQNWKNSDDAIIPAKGTAAEESAKERLRNNVRGFRVLVSNSELRKRILITSFSWMVASLSYYALGKRRNINLPHSFII